VYASALELLGIAAPERMDRPKDEALDASAETQAEDELGT
jgi:hypothetical protein